MKNSKSRISANEINRFVYCPYQWYYKRYYGTRELNEKYKALEIESDAYEENLVKGLNHHKRYYLHYKIKLWIQLLIGIGLLLAIIGRVIEWNMS